MTKIFLARHGESDWNVSKRIQGQYNSNLTAKGLKEAELLAKRLEKENIDVIYTSDLDRAYFTGLKLAELNEIQIIKDKRLRELYFGDWQEKYRSELIKENKKDYYTWLKEPENFTIPGGENLDDLRVRMESVLNDIITNNIDKNVLIVSHGVAIKIGILLLLNAPNNLYKNLSMDNVGVSLVELRDFNNVLRYHNDTNHLGVISDGE